LRPQNPNAGEDGASLPTAFTEHGRPDGRIRAELGQEAVEMSIQGRARVRAAPAPSGLAPPARAKLDELERKIANSRHPYCELSSGLASGLGLQRLSARPRRSRDSAGHRSCTADIVFSVGQAHPAAAHPAHLARRHAGDQGIGGHVLVTTAPAPTKAYSPMLWAAHHGGVGLPGAASDPRGAVLVLALDERARV